MLKFKYQSNTLRKIYRYHEYFNTKTPLSSICCTLFSKKFFCFPLKDNEYFYATHKFYSFDDFSKQLAVHLKRYNSFPMRPLAWKSPKQYVSDYLNFGLLYN